MADSSVEDRHGPARPRVLLFHNFLTPYRVPLFAELAQRFDLDVWILGDVKSIRDWPSELPRDAFRCRVLPHVTIPLGSRYNVILLNPTLPWELARHRHDVILCCAWDTPAVFYASWHARFTRTPFILWSGSTPVEDTLLRRLTKPWVKGLVRRANAWLAYGTRAKEYLASLGADPARTFRAFNTVETDRFARESRLTEEEKVGLRTRHGLTAPNIVLYCGNLLDLKGVGDLIEAFGLFARERGDTQLLLVGSGGNEAAYRARCVALGIEDRVVFAGFIPAHEVARYYGIADLLVLPSRSEIWGLVINEALAAGLPVVASDAAGASADLVRDGENGYVVPSRAPESLAKALGRYFSATTDREAMRSAARESIRPFSIAAMAEAFEQAVSTALKGSSPRKR